MPRSALLRAVPEVPAATAEILDPLRGPLGPPNRSEIFGPERFAQHGRSLGATHAASYAVSGSAAFFPRLKDNIRILRESHACIGEQASAGNEVSPAAEWLLDNFHLIEAQLREIREGLPRRYFRDLPVLQDEPLVGLPRVYGVAWAFVAHTDSAFDEDLLVHFLKAYEETRELTLGELWALPTTLRVVLIENLRRLAERAAANKAAREVANICCDRIESFDAKALDEVLAQMNRRAVGDTFLSQMAQQLQDHRSTANSRYFEWLQQAAPNLAEIQTRLPAEQAADNLSTSNAITSLRSIGDADWPEIVAATSVLTQLMLTSPAFEAERDDTRDQSLHAVELLSRKSGRSEREVATTLLELMRSGVVIPSSGAAAPGDDAADSRAAASFWLKGGGRNALRQRVGLADDAGARLHQTARRFALLAYLGAIGGATAAAVAWLLHHPGSSLPPLHVAPWLVGFAALLMLFPVSEAVVAVVNRLISESARPIRMPRLAFANGIPAEHRTMLVVPAMLTGVGSGAELAHHLQLHYLANPEPAAQFALLTDFTDADSERVPGDDAVLAAAIAEVERLNRLYPTAEAEPARFVLLHRERRFAPSERRWIGWERKRGKLEQLIALLAEGGTSPFLDFGRSSHVATGTAYVVTLDSDTRLPPGRLRDLVGVAAHPHNLPRLSADGRRVEHGYGILQPHVATPLPNPGDVTLFHWLFAGQPGIDPYSAASSEVYQDVFDEGTFTGKGLLHVQAMHAALGGRLPESQVLSHDLLEGSLARCAAVTDINVIEDAPFHADVAASRVHRWTRGDWQLLPFLLRPGRWPMRAVNRWKMLDNLRRSLVAPMSLAAIVFSLATGLIAPVTMLLLVALAFSAGPLMGAMAGFSPSRDDIAYGHFYRQAAADLGRAVASGAWQMAQLLQLALMSADAIVLALWRMASRRHLLEWTTAAAAQAAATTELAGLLKKHWAAPLGAVVLWAALMALPTPYPLASDVLCLLWAFSPVWTWWVSRPRPAGAEESLSAEERDYLGGVARETWRLFEHCVRPGEHDLPPDNLQTVPNEMVAHRTSPTNIGLYLLATACAHRFGWLGSAELIRRTEATLATMAGLQRHRGHFLNWYDTMSAQALLPMYVSTVDSGNLCTHLLAVAQAADELRAAPFDLTALRRGLSESAARVAVWRAAAGRPITSGAWAAAEACGDPFALDAEAALRLGQQLDAAEIEIQAWMPLPEADLPPRAEHRLAWAALDHVSTLRSALLDAAALRDATAPVDAQARLEAIAATCRRIAVEADFSFLFNKKRRLFHIGFRVTELQLDAGYYDLLASEARATSLWAIAKGDVPATHWAALGRPFYAVGDLAGLRSWSGSMFEYLMPTLILEEPHGSVLHSAAAAAVLEHIGYGRDHHVPWGISESAYAASDHTLAYQYAPQGVPRLALRRTPADELVIAPYATVLAAQVAPHRAALNLHRLEAARARERYGFIEALDYTPARQSADEGVARVYTFMAHHQGMSLVALANVLLDRMPRRWGMGDPRIEAVLSLLHERAPREVPPLLAAPLSREPSAPRRAPGMVRDVRPGMAAIEPTHLLSNGRYAVSLRPNGAGTSRCGGNTVTRSRDDALRDMHGCWFYLRWDRQPAPVSITQHPAPDPEADYTSVFLADRVSFTAAWPELEATTTVWVSPEDDIEFRRIVLCNAGDRSLDLELLNAFEVTLADARADESHPAFQNLFIGAEWQAEHQALVFERKPRLATDKGVLAAHFLAETDAPGLSLRVQVDRARWLGRNRDAARPLAAFDEPPAAPADGGSARLDTGLDPVSAFAARLQIPPHGKVRLTFCIAAAGDRATLRAVIDKYRQPANIERASLMSATLNAIRLRETRISAENFAAIQTLGTALALSVTRAHLREAEAGSVCDRRLLWRFGISGDRPIVLVSAGVAQGIGLLRSLAQALRVWSWGGIACDLVVINYEPASYVMALNRSVAGLREAYAAQSAAQPGVAESGFHVLQASDLQPDEISTLRVLARVRFSADGRPLAHHVQELAELHERAAAERTAVSSVAVPAEMGGEIVPLPSSGDFAQTSGEFRFDVSALTRPARPWVNVLANPNFGAQLSEAGGGYSWAVNSRLNMLTPWSNDPVSDPSGEWFLLQDMRTLAVWSVTPSAAGDAAAEYRVAHGQGYSVVSHRRGALEVNASWCVDPETAVKQVRIRLVNRGHRTLQLRVVGIAEWIVGAHRSDRASTHTFRAELGAPPAASGSGARNTSEAEGAAPAPRMTALFCTQRDRSAGFGDGTAFLGLASEGDDGVDWTCDRRESFDARGRIVVPDHYAQAAGCGLDPCAALAARVQVRAGESAERVFLLGYGASPEAARSTAEAASRVPALTRIQRVRDRWNELLGATTVRTPDPLFDAMVNRWLLYQTIACRLWARAGFYQAGGAYGYRDQLQDSLALAWAAPDLLRKQIVLAAQRQFAEGDVQHWWHAPTGAGVRTHFSDDLLWLPYACAHYLEATGDAALLDEAVPFLEGAGIPEGAEDAYYAPVIGSDKASVYEHCARAIDHSLRTGAHGLPLMGTGDWNDGMNRVGHEGRGESVWLAWFLCEVVAGFSKIASARGESARVERWAEARRGWLDALAQNGWDGEWYRRAFFDDGSSLGSKDNVECRIDLIAQAWAVISGAAPEHEANQAMASLENHLVDKETGLLRLLDPPLAQAQPSAGYIQAYPPGVRENGGQYSHAGVWALMAQAARGDGDAAYRYFGYLSPAHRSRHPTRAHAYLIEPYVMAGDIYSAAPYAGRGGWSWYTGSAAWMHRAAVESMFGLRLHGDEIAVEPCLPTSWPRAEISLARNGKKLRLVCLRGAPLSADEPALRSARALRPGERLRWSEIEGEATFVVSLGTAPT